MHYVNISKKTTTLITTTNIHEYPKIHSFVFIQCLLHLSPNFMHFFFTIHGALLMYHYDLTIYPTFFCPISLLCDFQEMYASLNNINKPTLFSLFVKLIWLIAVLRWFFNSSITVGNMPVNLNITTHAKKDGHWLSRAILRSAGSKSFNY